MKKFLALALALIMTAALFAGCGASNVKYVECEDYLGDEQYGIGFRNEDVALGLKVCEILEEMIEDGTAAKISEEWFGKDVLLKNMDYVEEAEAKADDDSLQKILDAGKMVVGGDVYYPPMAFLDGENIVGFDVDLAREVCKRMGVELEYIGIDWDSKEMELSSGNIDCIWNGMSMTEERIDAMYFAKPYIANQMIVIVADNSGITKVADLDGKIVGMQKGSSAVEAFYGNPISEKAKEAVEYADNQAAYLDLKAGRIDALVVDSVAGRYMLATDADNK